LKAPTSLVGSLTLFAQFGFVWLEKETMRSASGKYGKACRGPPMLPKTGNWSRGLKLVGNV